LMFTIGKALECGSLNRSVSELTLLSLLIWKKVMVFFSFIESQTHNIALSQVCWFLPEIPTCPLCVYKFVNACLSLEILGSQSQLKTANVTHYTSSQCLDGWNSKNPVKKLWRFYRLAGLVFCWLERVLTELEWVLDTQKNIYDFSSVRACWLCSVCDHAKIFRTSKFSYLLFSNPTCKTKTAIANRWETTNSKPTVLIRNREQQSDHIYYSLLWQVFSLALTFNQPQQTVQKCCPETVLLSRIAMFWLSSSHFNLQGHILSTNGVALRIGSSYNKFCFANVVVLKDEELKCFHSSWNCYVCQRQINDCLVIDEGETFLQFLFVGRHRMWDDCVFWSCSVS
jgi:hypothetical protein